jgi:hypothetical protein
MSHESGTFVMFLRETLPILPGTGKWLHREDAEDSQKQRDRPVTAGVTGTTAIMPAEFL